MSNRNLCRIQLKTNQSNFLTRRPEESGRNPSESKSHQRNRPVIQTRDARRLFCSKPPLQTDSIRQNRPSTLTTMLSSVR